MKMDETKFEKVYNAVRILIKEQKVQSMKISELENKNAHKHIIYDCQATKYISNGVYVASILPML
mgnify:CR=1 FL=1